MPPSSDGVHLGERPEGGSELTCDLHLLGLTPADELTTGQLPFELDESLIHPCWPSALLVYGLIDSNDRGSDVVEELGGAGRLLGGRRKKDDPRRPHRRRRPTETGERKGHPGSHREWLAERPEKAEEESEGGLFVAV